MNTNGSANPLAIETGFGGAILAAIRARMNPELDPELETMYPPEPRPAQVPRLPTDRQMKAMSYDALRALHNKFTRYNMHLVVKLGKAKSTYTNYRDLQEKTPLALRSEIRTHEPDTDASTRKEMVSTDLRLVDIDAAVMHARGEFEYFNGQVKSTASALRNIEEYLYGYTRRGPQVPDEVQIEDGYSPDNPARPHRGRRVRPNK